jgi:hypothetical protein
MGFLVGRRGGSHIFLQLNYNFKGHMSFFLPLQMMGSCYTRDFEKLLLKYTWFFHQVVVVWCYMDALWRHMLFQVVE